MVSHLLAEQNVERQVLQTQCRRLEAQHYSLSLTAEQLSHSMAVSDGHFDMLRGGWGRTYWNPSRGKLEADLWNGR